MTFFIQLHLFVIDDIGWILTVLYMDILLEKKKNQTCTVYGNNVEIEKRRKRKKFFSRDIRVIKYII